MSYQPIKRWRLLSLVMVLCCAQASAGVVITGTRLIYPANEREITVKLDNNGTTPSLVQAWVDSGDVASSPTQSTAPFVLSPPVFRLDPSKGQSMRLMFRGAVLPPERESVFWLNVLEIPPKGQVSADTNILQMAFRSRIKIFYRPENLAGTPIQAIEQVQWKLVPAPGAGTFALQARNPSAFHVSLVELVVVDGSRREPSEDGMIGPGETKLFAVPGLKAFPASAAIEFNAINDYGALVPIKKQLQP
ncbi:fimbrial biogenesis chaperone [Pseudomonas sp. GT1P32]